MKKVATSLVFLWLSVGLLNAQQHVPIAECGPTVSQDVIATTVVGVQDERQLNDNNLTTHSTPIWGSGASVGSLDGQFANAFVQAVSFTPGDNINSWTALTIYDNSNVTPGNAYWTRSTLGYSQGAYWSGTTPVNSSTAANGVAIFDSDFMDNAGVPGNFGGGVSPSIHKGELISPRIDLTGYADTGIAIEFFSFSRNFNTTEYSVSLSTDDGTTWTTVDIRSLITDLTQETVSAVFSNATAGLSNLTQCRIKFTYEGDYYFYILDDVLIKTAPDYDLTIAELDSTGGVTGLNYGDQVHITGNRFFPIGQLTQDAGHISFGANVKNLGVVDVATSLNPSLNLNIEKLDNVSGTWSSVHTQSIAASQDITAAGLSLTGTLNNTSWMQVGSYRATYTAAFNGTDADTSNNTAQHFFDITANNYASKVSNDGNGNPLADRRIFPGGGPFSQWEYGSVFNLQNASGSGLSVDEVKFTYYLPGAFTGAANQVAFIHIYSINDADNNGIITDQTELTQIAIGTSILTGLGTTLSRNAYHTATVTGLVNASNGRPLGELPSGKYFVSIVFNTSLTGGAATFDVNDVPWMGASEAKDYNMNYGLVANYTDHIFNPSALGFINAAGSASFNRVGFGLDVIPSIGISFSTSRNTTIADGSYSNNTTWSNGLIPATNEITVINHDIVVDSDATLLGNTTINVAKSLMVDPGVVLTLQGSLDNSNGGMLIFKSDATGVGQLLVNSGGSLSGPATVERFVPALANTRRAYRFITPAVTTTGSIYENWQENGNSPSGYGTHITGSITGANGFDATASGNPSLFTYEHLSDSWQAIPNTDTEVLVAGKAYRIMVRGDRNFDLNNATQQPVNSDVVLRATGNLNLADVSLVGNIVNSSDAGALSRQAGEFSFIGNPYQAIVDFESLAKTNINPNFVYLWNPNLSTAGAYETIDVSGAIDPKQYLQPGQAFFVLTENNGDASITFNESAKSPSDFSNTNFTVPTSSNFVELTLSDAHGLQVDRLKIHLDGLNEINNLDAPKLYNIDENLSTFTNGANFSIEHRDTPQDGEVIQLHLTGHDRLDYVLDLQVNLPQGLKAVLIDNYLNTNIVLEQGANPVTFSIDYGIAGSTATDRFLLRFEQEELLSIPGIELNVYPNPASNGELHLNAPDLANQVVQISMVNMLGQVILNKKYEVQASGVLSMNTTAIPQGTYIISVRSEGINASKKVIIK